MNELVDKDLYRFNNLIKYVSYLKGVSSDRPQQVFTTWLGTDLLPDDLKTQVENAKKLVDLQQQDIALTEEENSTILAAMSAIKRFIREDFYKMILGQNVIYNQAISITEVKEALESIPDTNNGNIIRINSKLLNNVSKLDTYVNHVLVKLGTCISGLHGIEPLIKLVDRFDISTSYEGVLFVYEDMLHTKISSIKYELGTMYLCDSEYRTVEQAVSVDPLSANVTDVLKVNMPVYDTDYNGVTLRKLEDTFTKAQEAIEQFNSVRLKDPTNLNETEIHLHILVILTKLIVNSLIQKYNKDIIDSVNKLKEYNKSNTGIVEEE